jgi:hypothetical protein
VFDISGLDWRTRRDQWPDNEYSDDELGEGYYDVKARAYDKKMANVFNYDFDCKKEYRDDVVSLENLATLQKTDPDAIEHSSTGRCFVLASLVQSWNNGLAYFDKESGRVVPQYPRDPQTRSDNMPPEELFWFYDRAVALGQWKVNKSKPQAIDAILSENVRNALVDIYRFIIAYDALQISYGFTDDKKIEKNDIAFFSRRDIQASQWLEKIYKKYGVDSMFGTRKYTDIPSGRNAPQVFYSCFLVALIRSLGFRAKLDPDQNVTWRFEAGECDEFTNERDICRPCVHKWIIKPKA